MKKVLYVTNLPAPYKITFLGLLSKSFDLTVVYERKRALDRNEKWVSHEVRTYKEIFLRAKNLGNESSLSFDIIRILKKKRFDVVLMNGYSSPTAIIAIMYMKYMHINYAIICDGMLPNADSKIKFKLKRFLIKNAGFYFSSGKITDEQLVKYGANKENIYRYPFGSVSQKDIIGDSFDKQTFKKKIDCESNNMLLYVGQFIERKGLDILFKAIKDLKVDFTLFMVGGTIEEASCFEGYDNPHIRYCGFKTKQELSDFYRAADVFVLPTREDIWGLVINEAMMFGLPVITTKRCGAGLEMVNNVSGYILNNDGYELTSVIEQSLNKIWDTQKIKEIAEKYSLEEMASSVEKILNKLI